MTGTPQQYFEMLARSDHPVFFKDYSTTTDINSPLNSIFNRVIALQLFYARQVMNEFQLNLVPDTVTSMTISDWETQYFGFTKPSTPLAQRVAELLIKFNKRFTMSLADVIALSQAITGKTPLVVRNVSRTGWVLGQGALGISTVLSDPSEVDGQGLYLVAFTEPLASNLLNQLDIALSGIEKAGSRHKITSPTQYWVLGDVALGINTTL